MNKSRAGPNILALCNLCNARFFKVQRCTKHFELFYSLRSFSFQVDKVQIYNSCVLTGFSKISFRCYSTDNQHGKGQQHHRHHKKPTAHSSTYLYDVLLVSPNATQSQIKNSYFKLTKLYHPDVNDSPDSVQTFHEISQAYEILGNARKRRLYDRGILPTEFDATHGDFGEVEHPIHRTGFRRVDFKPRHKRSPTGRDHIYNFDEFYRKHYADTLIRTRREKFIAELRNRHFDEQEDIRRENVSFRPVSWFLIFLGGFIVYKYLEYEKKEAVIKARMEARKAKKKNVTGKDKNK